MSPYQLERNGQPNGQTAHSVFAAGKSNLCFLGKRQEEKVTVQSFLKVVIFPALAEEGTISSTNPGQNVFKFMSLVYNMISYHPEFRKWLWGLVLGCWGQEWMTSVHSWGHGSGQGTSPGHSVQVQVCSTSGYWKNQFSFDPQSNPMVGQTQDLSPPGDLTASSTSNQRKSLVKIRKRIIRTDHWISRICIVITFVTVCIS